MKKIELKPIDYGSEDLDMMSVSEWIEYVNDGGFIDYDGFGYLATSTNESNLRVYPSYVLENMIVKVSIDFEEPNDIKQEDIKQFTHIIWYNR